MSDEDRGDSPAPPAGNAAKDVAPSGSASKGDSVRRITLVVLGLCAVVLVWYVLADQHTPYTPQGRIQAVVVPIVPRVSGYLTETRVQLHSLVEPEEVLFRLDRRTFELAVRAAEANVDQTAQKVGAQTATVKSAVARLGVARAQEDRARRNFDRTQRVLTDNPGALSQADRDRSETSLAQAIERVASAEADLEKAQQQLGTSGPENAELRGAIVGLEQAQLDLAFTTVYAPARGVIESYDVDVGHYAQAGQPLATFISTHDVWIQADMRENNLARIEPGDPVEFVLDAAPGRVFGGSVRSVGYGVGSATPSNRGTLPTVSSSDGWLRDPQRFPVVVGLNEGEANGYRRVGGQADVIVYTGNNALLNGIGKLRIRLTSWLSYVR